MEIIPNDGFGSSLIIHNVKCTHPGPHLICQFLSFRKNGEVEKSQTDQLALGIGL